MNPGGIFPSACMLLLGAVSLSIGNSLPAAPVAFSGKVAINGLNYSGVAAFTFALRDQNGTVHWRNGANADDPINVPVDRGHYLVLLGDEQSRMREALIRPIRIADRMEIPH